jgi:acetate---CoA ligase (ADP-forming)
MVDSLRAKRLLEGFRALPACDRRDITAVAQALGRLMTEHLEIAEVELNPLRITANGALALDALVVLANPSDTETTA